MHKVQPKGHGHIYIYVESCQEWVEYEVWRVMSVRRAKYLLRWTISIGLLWTFWRFRFSKVNIYTSTPPGPPLPLLGCSLLDVQLTKINRISDLAWKPYHPIPSPVGSHATYRWESVSRIGRKPLREKYSYAEWTSAGKYRDLSRISYWVQYFPLFYVLCTRPHNVLYWQAFAKQLTHFLDSCTIATRHPAPLHHLQHNKLLPGPVYGTSFSLPACHFQFC